LLLPRRRNARDGKDGQEMELAGSQVPSKEGTKVKQPSPSSQLWVALSLLASPWTLPPPSRLNSCLTLDGDSVSVYFVSGCRLVKHLSRVLVPSTHVEDGGFDQSLQLPAMATRCASFLMFCSTPRPSKARVILSPLSSGGNNAAKRSAQFLYLIAHRRKCSIAAWFNISRVRSEPESSRFVSTSQLNA
jgi:hypothetical protein